MTTQTPIGTVWDGNLLRPALPGATDVTRFSEETGHVLSAHGDPFAFVDDAWLQQPVPVLGDQFLVTMVSSPAKQLHEPSRWIRYQITGGGIVAMLDAEESENPRAFYRSIEDLKERLGLDWSRVVHLLGVKRRTFFSYRKAGVLPVERVADFKARVRLLDALATEDIEATRVLIRSKADELVELFATGDYSAVRALVVGVRERLSAPIDRGSSELATAIVRYASEIANIVAQPAFEALAKVYASFRPLGLELERTKALVETQEAVQAGHDGSLLAERWDFLPLMTHAAMEEFRGAATAFIRSSAFAPGTWESFISRASERAWRLTRH